MKNTHSMSIQAASEKKIRPSFGDGNEAIAWAAEDAGVSYVAHYPGSPVNRVIDVLAKTTLTINHALNEHIAALAVMGASLCGARSLLVMKHVGLNIAADPLNYAGVTKITGGMVVVVGTDAGARSSTGEEDVHWYAPQFNLPLFEPASVHDIYETVKNAYDISERVQLPVLVFVAGRLAYQTNLIQRTQPVFIQKPLHFSKDQANLINVGQRAVNNHKDHILRIARFAVEPANCNVAFNRTAEIGLITRGTTFAIVHELIMELGLVEQVHLLNIERTFPLHLESLLGFAQGKKKITVIEDQDGFLETLIKRDGFGKIACPVHGKDYFPAWGEISHQQVREFLVAEFDCVDDKNNIPIFEMTIACPDRPGTFCEGCPHRPTFYAIDQALQASNGIIGGDIGCSSLPPHRTDWLLCMNAGIGMSQGIAHLLPEQSLVSTGGDGSLFHGGLISLLSAVENNINLTHILLDNRSIAMSGHQHSPSASGNVDMRKLLESIGIAHIFEVSAFMPSQLTRLIEQAKALNGVKVIWVRGGCALQPDEEALRRLRERTLKIDSNRCASCTLCYSTLQCPAISQSPETARISIDMDRCRRCTACLDVCPNNAIIVSDSAIT
jgi:indolepyruvate ferredoxin oxidoreductase, alpha subunit